VLGYSEKIMLIAGNAHPALAQGISRNLGIPLAAAHIARFPDGEIDIKVNDDLRGADCFVIHPTCPPVNENWIELLLLLDTLRRASAGRITAVMPYYGYARKDRKDEGRVPISAKVVANTLVQCGADRLLTLDMHAAQIQGFYDIPVDHLYAKPALLSAIRRIGLDRPVIVSPDVGGIKMARAYAKALDNADLAIVDKRRISGSEIAVEHVIGQVEDRNVIIVDDMISTGGSISEAAKIVRKHGAKPVWFMSWAYADKPEMTAELAEAYTRAANDNDAFVIPAGLAFARALKERPDLVLYASDKRHPSLAGTYLAAATVYAALLKKSPVGLGYTAGLDEPTAKLLQSAASETVQDYFRPVQAVAK